MRYAPLVTTIINYIFSGILWILGILTFVFNLLGLWELWHLAGFGLVFCAPLVIIPQVAAFYHAFYADEDGKKYVILNLIAFLISLFFVFFTIFVSSGWFW